MNYEFNGRDDLLLQKGRSSRKNRHSGKQTNSCDSSIDTENNDVNSLTYSASSSQAGESTDSSIADFTYLLEQQQHMLQQQNAQRSKHHHIHQRPRSGSGQFARENSLGYSDDTDYDDDQGPGQPSSSSEKIVFSPASHGESRIKRVHRTNGTSTSTPNNGKHLKSRVNSFSSPAGVASSDFSSGGGSGSSHTPSSPTPPRHKKVSEEGTEMWYAKWWMCGFTDALNLNSKC